MQRRARVKDIPKDIVWAELSRSLLAKGRKTITFLVSKAVNCTPNSPAPVTDSQPLVRQYGTK